MSDIIYVENELNGMEVLINDIEQEVTPEGLIFVRNGKYRATERVLQTSGF